MTNKRGISGIVVALILVLLSLVAAGIIWFVIRNITEGGVGEIGLGTKCLEVDIRATKAACTPTGICNVTVTRSAGGEEIAGVKLIFTNDEGVSNYIYDQVGNIVPLGAKTVTSINTSIVNVSKVDVAIYFKDEAGKEQLCSGATSFEF